MDFQNARGWEKGQVSIPLPSHLVLFCRIQFLGLHDSKLWRGWVEGLEFQEMLNVGLGVLEYCDMHLPLSHPAEICALLPSAKAGAGFVLLFCISYSLFYLSSNCYWAGSIPKQ